MNEISIFQNPDFGQIRIIQNAQGEPLFCLTDLCVSLDLRASDVKRRLDDDVVSTHTVKDSLGRKNLLCFVNEDGLYDVILDSRKPEAKAFRKWVTSEVLPQIRKTGGYIPVAQEDDEKTILAKAVQILMKTVEVQKQSLEAQRLELAEQDVEIARLAPKAEYAEEVLMSPTCYTMTQVAKSLSMTVQQLQRQLHQMRIIYRSPSGCWMLYADHLKRGYEAYRTKKGVNLFGETIWADTYLVWTERGKEFIYGLMSA